MINHTRALGSMLVLLMSAMPALTGCVAGEMEDLEEDLGTEEVGEASDAILFGTCVDMSLAPDMSTSANLYNVEISPDYGQSTCASYFLVDRTTTTAGTYKVSVSLPGNTLSGATCPVGKVEVYVITSNGTQLHDYTMGTWDGTNCVATADITFSEAAGATFRAAFRAERGYIDGRQPIEVKFKFSEYKL